MSLELALAIVGAIGAVVVPFILSSVSKQNERMKTMEDRIFDMNGNHVTKEELKDELRELETRVSRNIIEKWDSVKSELQSMKELMLLLVKKDKE